MLKPSNDSEWKPEPLQWLMNKHSLRNPATGAALAFFFTPLCSVPLATVASWLLLQHTLTLGFLCLEPSSFQMPIWLTTSVYTNVTFSVSITLSVRNLPPLHTSLFPFHPLYHQTWVNICLSLHESDHNCFTVHQLITSTTWPIQELVHCISEKL